MRRWINGAVVVLLLLLGVGLFLPALCSWRDWAGRTACQNNLKQIGLATLSYQDQHLVFPSGTTGNPLLPPEERLSWLTTLLPYLEPDGRAEELDTDVGWQSEKNRAALNRTISIFQCPSEANRGVAGAPGYTHYVGIAGVGLDSPLLPVVTTWCRDPWRPYRKIDKRAGMFGYDRVIRWTDVGDGSSNTIMAAEAASSFGPWPAGGPATVRALDPDDTPYVGLGRQFGRAHATPSFLFYKPPVRVNVVLVDGSTRSVMDTISPGYFEALVTIAGEEMVGPD
jgi:hypothetical protein